ncbi:MAG: RelA/SpoT family protein [Candidatus Puniceispirillaceae bacterium]
MQNAFEDLVSRIRSYHPTLDEDRLLSAYQLGQNAHDGQLRASGEAYFTHPISVAGILCDMHMDLDTIITALLHDTVEDCDVSLDQIQDLFGEDVATLVDGVTKLTRIELQSEGTKQAENLRKLVVAMSRDIRVLLVKLADRMHNMQTIDSFAREDKKARIAKETRDIYAPLAERIGVTHIQRELEDRAFSVLVPEMRQSILARLDFLAADTDNVIPRICQEIQSNLNKAGIECQVFGRRKTPYSIWRKMQIKNVQMEHLADVMGFRLIVPTKADCYRALGILHEAYPMVMGRFKDYISTPKRNGYQSIHTGVIGPLNRKIEIQIRTAEMHDTAERGVAAHWSYKARGEDRPTPEYSWLKDLISLIEMDNAASDFLEHTKLEMYDDQVFCFTPRGDLIALPKGASAVDFAYAVHSKVGDHCVGVMINQKARQLATELENGDQVQIITDKDAMPKPEWEDFVKTGRAKSAIKRFERQTKFIEFSRVGRALLDREFRYHQKELDDDMITQSKAILGMSKIEDLYVDIADGKRSVKDVFHKLYPEIDRKDQVNANEPRQDSDDISASFEIDDVVDGMAVHIAKCCHPLPGEDVVGIVTTGKGVTVHGKECDTLRKFVEAPELWLKVQWNRRAVRRQIVKIRATLIHEPGALAALCTGISQLDANITNLQSLERDRDFFTFLVDMEVRDVAHLKSILAILGSNKFVESVSRYSL